jgi:sugar phosphate isomerase/epimerase
MRLGINEWLGHKNPDEWIQSVRRMKVRAVIAPMGYSDSRETKQAYLNYIQEEDLVIGEVGIWRNSLDPDREKRKSAIEFSKQQLTLAEEIGANCCVNISGSAGEDWAGYYPENYSEDFYALLIDTVREIVDSVKPKRTYYTIEPMQWMHPDSPDDYLKLLQDIDRKEVAVHLDYVNMINSFEKYHNRNEFIKECFRKLGAYTKSIHAKDIILGPESPCCLRETMPGKGRIDFGLVLRLANKLDKDMPVFVEHLHSMEEFGEALTCLRKAQE